MNGRTYRRQFLKAGAAGSAGWWILANSRSARSARANDKLNIAIIGVGGWGRVHIGKVLRTGNNLVALCDVNQNRLDQPADLPDGVRKYRDFRRLLDEMDRQIDAVVVATTDHNHAAVTAAAMRRGKHVYCEKPLTHDIGEARTIRQMLRERKGLMTQMGNQGPSNDTYRRVVEQVQQGVVGEVREVHAWFSENGGTGPIRRPTDTPAVPETLDWDVYLGPVAFRPYHTAYMKPYDWRDFTTGMLGGGFSHSVHMAFRGLDIGALWDAERGSNARIRVEAEFSEPCPDNFPRWEIIHFDIPMRGKLPPVRINWYNGTEKFNTERGIVAKMEKIAGRSLDWKGGWAPISGSLLVGSKGVVHSNPHCSMCRILPEKDFPNQGGPPQTIPASGSRPTLTEGETGQQVVTEWAAACKGGRQPFGNFEYSSRAIELILLGNIATLVGKPLEYDPVSGRITNNDEADRAIRPARREGWSL